MLEKEKLLLRIKKLSKKIGSVKIYLNEYKTEGTGMGYYFDKNDKLWKSYVFGQFNFISKKSQNEILSHFEIMLYLSNFRYKVALDIPKALATKSLSFL